MLNKKVLCAQDFSSTKANIPEIDGFWKEFAFTCSFFYFYFFSIEFVTLKKNKVPT